MNQQHAFTFLGPLKNNDTTKVREALKEIDQGDVESNPWFPFLKMESIHFARILVLEGTAISPPYLVFSTNYDGDLEKHLSEIITVSDTGFFKVFGECENCPEENSSTEERIAFMRQYSDYTAYFHKGTWRRTVKQIRVEEETRQLAEDYLDNIADKNADIKAIHSSMVAYLKSKGALQERFPPVIVPKIHTINKILVIIFTLLLFTLSFPWLLIAAVTAVAVMAITLRIHENKEEEFQYDDTVDISSTTTFANREDRIVQNQLTHLVEVKPGSFRLFMLKMVLRGIQKLATYVYNKGKLGNIPTIHFARWVIIDNGKRLLFFSNYDGSWESYLGDFIDKAAAGLTGVWSNTKLFPKTKWLIKDGARDEERFKAWTRTHQEYTDIWYSAYKRLSVKNILRNTEIYEGFHRTDMTEEETKKWLEKF